jgi:hypothetical protein
LLGRRDREHSTYLQTNLTFLLVPFYFRFKFNSGNAEALPTLASIAAPIAG